jgi:hypothetical protein
VVTNLKRLSEALDKAALTSQSTAEGIVAQIRADRKRIAEDIERTGAAYVVIDGRRFKVLASDQGR